MKSNKQPQHNPESYAYIQPDYLTHSKHTQIIPTTPTYESSSYQQDKSHQSNKSFTKATIVNNVNSSLSTRYNTPSSSSENNNINNNTNKLTDFLLNEEDTSPRPIIRSRSNSSVAMHSPIDPLGLTTAEQKRRCNIQYGFDRLQTLVPSLQDPKNSKASKATMLKKTSDYIKGFDFFEI